MRTGILRSVTLATALLLGVSACSDGYGEETEVPEAGTTAPGTSEGVDAAGFVACLQAAGVEAKVSERGGYVVLRDDSILDGATSDGELSIGTDDGGGPGIIYGEGGGDGNWVAVADSTDLGSDPDLQDAYAACEAELPGFEQPESGGLDDPELQADMAEVEAAALEFARCAREAGHSWVADPESGSGGGIELPLDLTESEFRAVLEDCYSPDAGAFGWVTTGELGFDLFAVLDEVGPGGPVAHSSVSGDQ